MARFLLLLVLAAGALLLVNGVSLDLDLDLGGGAGSTGTRIEGRSVTLDAGDLEVEFTRLDPLAEDFMVFGGDGTQRRNGMSHASLAGLPMRHARVLHARYPDFHLCRSPGAERAKALIESLSFVASDGAARDALVEALALHERRVRSGGERTCVRVAGARLALEAVRIKQDGRDVTGELPPLFRQIDYALADEVEVADCGPLLE